MVLCLNASDDRGAQVLRQQLAHFCSLRPIRGAFPLRFVVLDEADSLTMDAQEVLISAMDRFPQTRFMVLCNFAERLDPQIMSRCVAIPFPRVTEDRLVTLLEQKCSLANISPPAKDELETIVRNSQGDIRCCLQALFARYIIQAAATSPS